MGQSDSLPVLPENQECIGSLDEYSIPREYDKTTKSLKFNIPSDHKIQKIIIPNANFVSFPTNLQNLEILHLPSCHLNSHLEDMNNTHFDFPKLKIICLNGNNLEKIPSFILKLPSLEELLLSRNSLKSIDSDLHVRKLDVSLNNFEVFPENLNPAIQELSIGFNKIVSLNVKSETLLSLSISGNRLQSISEECCFEKLEFLDVSYNKLMEITNVSKNFPNLKIFKANYNYLITFPTGFPVSIQKIYVTRNTINSFTESLENLTNLKSIYIYNNEIELLPELPLNLNKFMGARCKIQYFSKDTGKLKRLNLSENSLAQLPNFENVYLKNLDLQKNNIDSVDLKFIPNKIKILNLSFNPIKSLNGNIAIKRRLRTLTLINCGLTQLPPSLSQSNIEELNISENNIVSEIYLPQTLKIFKASLCQLKVFPSILCTLDQLNIVDLSSNELSRIDELPNCNLLSLSLNKIASLPTIPPKIKKIDLSHNLLRSFTFLPQFESIDVSHNQIKTFRLVEMKKLNTLKLSFNPAIYNISFSLIPNIIFLDVASTKVTFLDYPLPKLAEIVSCKLVFQNLQNSFVLQSIENDKLNHITTEAGYSEDIGLRLTMEDAIIIRTSSKSSAPSLFAVIDGHGGRKTASIAAHCLPAIITSSYYTNVNDLVTAINKFQVYLRSKPDVQDGATLALVSISGPNVGICHLGDSRVIIVRKDGTVRQLTNDHKANDLSEIEIVKSRNGFFENGRLSKQLAVTRSLGDFHVYGMINEPDALQYKITDQDYRIVIGCDGIFDVLTNEFIAFLVMKYRNVYQASVAVRNAALHRDTSDNVSALVINVDLKDKHSIPNILK